MNEQQASGTAAPETVAELEAKLKALKLVG
jgi:hypothetical protein